MNQALEQFRQQVLQTPALADQFNTVSNSDEFASLAVQMGQQLGFSFTTEEVKAALAQQSASEAAELSDTQLEAVAGGKSNNPNCDFTNGQGWPC